VGSTLGAKSAIYNCLVVFIMTVVMLNLEVLYPLTSNTRILKEIVNKGSYLLLVYITMNSANNSTNADG